MARTACTEPQCLYKGALYLYFYCQYKRVIVVAAAAAAAATAAAAAATAAAATAATAATAAVATLVRNVVPKPILNYVVT